MRVNRVIAIGDFDGVHLGHRALFRALQEWAESLHAEAFLLSFDQNTKNRKVITEKPVKEYHFRRYGITHWQNLSFEEWKEVSAEDFAEQFLKEELGAVGVLAGQDFHFGKDRAGNEFTLIAKGIAVKKIENETLGDLRISSSSIRKLVEEGNLPEAEQQMGHPFCLMGTVAHGKGLAKEYGMPTVNIPVSDRQLLPPFGVYAARVEVDGVCYPAVANIGVRPTVEKEGVPNAEAHILAEVPDLYGKEIRLELKAYLRREMKFESKDALFLQMKKDGEQSLARLEMLK